MQARCEKRFRGNSNDGDGCAARDAAVIPTSFPRFFIKVMNTTLPSASTRCPARTAARARTARVSESSPAGTPSRATRARGRSAAAAPPPPSPNALVDVPAPLSIACFAVSSAAENAPAIELGAAPTPRAAVAPRRDAKRRRCRAKHPRYAETKGPTTFFCSVSSSWSETGSLSKPGSKSVRDASKSHLSGRSVRTNDVLSSGARNRRALIPPPRSRPACEAPRARPRRARRRPARRNARRLDAELGILFRLDARTTEARRA